MQNETGYSTVLNFNALLCTLNFVSLHCTTQTCMEHHRTVRHCTKSTTLNCPAFYYRCHCTALHDVSEAVKLSVNMRVESHAPISPWWPGHLVGGQSGLTLPAKDTSWECPPHILQCYLHNVGGGCTAHQSSPDLSLGAHGNLMGGSRTEKSARMILLNLK